MARRERGPASSGTASRAKPAVSAPHVTIRIVTSCKRHCGEITGDPIGYVRLLATKMSWSIQNEELRDTHSYYFFRQAFPRLRWLPGFGVVFAVAIIALTSVTVRGATVDIRVVCWRSRARCCSSWSAFGIARPSCRCCARWPAAGSSSWSSG